MEGIIEVLQHPRVDPLSSSGTIASFPIIALEPRRCIQHT